MSTDPDSQDMFKAYFESFVQVVSKRKIERIP